MRSPHLARLHSPASIFLTTSLCTTRAPGVAKRGGTLWEASAGRGTRGSRSEPRGLATVTFSLRARVQRQARAFAGGTAFRWGGIWRWVIESQFSSYLKLPFAVVMDITHLPRTSLVAITHYGHNYNSPAFTPPSRHKNVTIPQNQSRTGILRGKGWSVPFLAAGSQTATPPPVPRASCPKPRTQGSDGHVLLLRHSRTHPEQRLSTQHSSQ